MKKILVTGGSGQVGGAVLRLSAQFGFAASAPTRSELDLVDARSIAAAVASEKWSAIINCAAYTAVDKAEHEVDKAHCINAKAPEILAEETARSKIPLIHVSTDYVFDGDKPSPYTETDAVNPIGVYARTKEAGEAAIRLLNPQHAIIRTAWVVSPGGANFLNTMLRLALERDEISVVEDQIGSPSSANDIAEALLTTAAKLGGRAGTWHFVNAGEASWHDLAKHIFGETARRGLRTPKLNAIATDAYPTLARRPKNSRLATSKFEQDFQIKPRRWQDAVDAILATRLAQ